MYTVIISCRQKRMQPGSDPQPLRETYWSTVYEPGELSRVFENSDLHAKSLQKEPPFTP